jgi:hypothetical protein
MMNATIKKLRTIAAVALEHHVKKYPIAVTLDVGKESDSVARALGHQRIFCLVVVHDHLAEVIFQTIAISVQPTTELENK